MDPPSYTTVNSKSLGFFGRPFKTEFKCLHHADESHQSRTPGKSQTCSSYRTMLLETNSVLTMLGISYCDVLIIAGVYLPLLILFVLTLKPPTRISNGYLTFDRLFFANFLLTWIFAISSFFLKRRRVIGRLRGDLPCRIEDDAAVFHDPLTGECVPPVSPPTFLEAVTQISINLGRTFPVVAWVTFIRNDPGEGSLFCEVPRIFLGLLTFACIFVVSRFFKKRLTDFTPKAHVKFVFVDVDITKGSLPMSSLDIAIQLLTDVGVVYSVAMVPEIFSARKGDIMGAVTKNSENCFFTLLGLIFIFLTALYVKLVRIAGFVATEHQAAECIA